MLTLLVLGSGLIFGDGIITPAISVVSAVEGISVINANSAHFIIPITIGILTGLFSIQKNGTSKIGNIFGPTMLIWFSTLSVLGIIHIIKEPQIFGALNPFWVYTFFKEFNLHQVLVILGFVMLVVTGGEALFADLGHFGKLPVRLSWLFIAYPALVLNYLGQGAFLLEGKKVIEGNIFYSMAPSFALVPLVVIATLATIIASQALITGAYSITAQAYSLGLLPYLKTKHTHKQHEGQIYIEMVNIFLYIGCVILVIVFKNSTNLASTYGLAVSADMLITTVSVLIIATLKWKWNKILVFILFGFFAIIDTTFLAANSLKFFEGGYVPISIAIIILALMTIWVKGTRSITKALKSKQNITVKKLLTLRDSSTSFTPNTTIILSRTFINSENDLIPPSSNLYFEKYILLPNHLIFLTIQTHKEPTMKNTRFEVSPIDTDVKNGTLISVKINVGFMEKLTVEKYLKQIVKIYPQAFDTDKSKWVYHIIHPKIITTEGSIKGVKLIISRIFKLMYRNSPSIDEVFHLGNKQHLTAEIIPINIK